MQTKKRNRLKIQLDNLHNINLQKIFISLQFHYIFHKSKHNNLNFISQVKVKSCLFTTAFKRKKVFANERNCFINKQNLNLKSG